MTDLILLKYLEEAEAEDGVTRTIPASYDPDMRVPVRFYLNKQLLTDMIDLARKKTSAEADGLAEAIKQHINASKLPSIVNASIGLPDVHVGYGFSIGHVAGFDMDHPRAIVSPAAIGYDINCGVRLVRTSLFYDDLNAETLEQLASKLKEYVPSGIAMPGKLRVTEPDVLQILEQGQDWAISNGYAWDDDRETCEDRGRFADVVSRKISKKARSRGQAQIGTLGAGNHYLEIQRIDTIFHEDLAKELGLKKDQICIMVHTGSRGLGHTLATEYITRAYELNLDREGLHQIDQSMPSFYLYENEAYEYINAMKAASNYAYCNRAIITYYVRKAFGEVFKTDPRELNMSLLYDVSHNIAREELHHVDGNLTMKRLLVHRKGATRALPLGHPDLTNVYTHIGQPVLIGGTMGTCSYILLGESGSMKKSLGSTCHGAGRRLGRKEARKIPYEDTLSLMSTRGIVLKTDDPQKISEEAPDAYKDINEVIDTCEAAGLTKKVIKLRPICVIKG